MAATYTLSGNPKTLLGGEDFERVRAYVTCDQPILTDPDTGEVRIIGEADLILAGASTTEFEVDLPGNGWTPDHFYMIHVEGRSRTTGANRVVTTQEFQMAADTTLADLPQAAPRAITVTDYESLIAARDEAAELRDETQEIRDDAAAITAPLTAPANSQVASYINTDGATKTALTATIAVFNLGAATADDTARINAALTACRLAGGGTVYGKPGENYKISAPLIVGSKTNLDLRASDLTLLPGSNSQMVTNYSDRTPVGTATDAAVTSGSNVVTTSLASVAQVGMTAYINGAGSNGFGELIGIVTAVDAGASTITLGKLHGTTIPANATATVSGAAIQLSNMDTYVRVLIRNAARGANGPNSGVARGSAVAGHSIFLRGVKHYEVDVKFASSTAGISFIWPTNAAHGVVRLWDCNVHRTGTQVVGPIFDLRLLTKGLCSDDLVNLCGNVYPDQTNTAGDVIGVTIEDIVGTGQSMGSVLKINPCQGNIVDSVRVEGRLSGAYSTGVAPKVWIMEDIVEPETTGGTCGSLDLGMIDFPTSNAGCLEVGTVAITSLKAHVIGRTVHPIRINPGDTNAAPPLLDTLDLTVDFAGETGDGIQVKNNARVGTLRVKVDGFRPINDRSIIKLNSATAVVNHLLVDSPFVRPPRALGLGLFELLAGTINKMSIVNPDIEWLDASNGLNVVRVAGATVGDLIFQGGRIVKGDALVRANSGALRTVRYGGGLTHTLGQRLLHTALASEVNMNGVRRIDCTQIAVFPQSSSVALTVQGEGFLATGTNNQLIATNGAASTVNGASLNVDVSQIGLKVGALAYNTNAALSHGVGLVVCDGGRWRALNVAGAVKTGTATLVGGTVTVADAAITATSSIRLSQRQVFGTPGALYVASRTIGVGFTIASTNAADASSVYYEIIGY